MENTMHGNYYFSCILGLPNVLYGNVQYGQQTPILPSITSHAKIGGYGFPHDSSSNSPSAEQNRANLWMLKIQFAGGYGSSFHQMMPHGYQQSQPHEPHSGGYGFKKKEKPKKIFVPIVIKKKKKKKSESWKPDVTSWVVRTAKKWVVKPFREDHRSVQRVLHRGRNPDFWEIQEN